MLLPDPNLGQGVSEELQIQGVMKREIIETTGIHLQGETPPMIVLMRMKMSKEVVVGVGVRAEAILIPEVVVSLSLVEKRMRMKIESGV